MTYSNWYLLFKHFLHNNCFVLKLNNTVIVLQLKHLFFFSIYYLKIKKSVVKVKLRVR